MSEVMITDENWRIKKEIPVVLIATILAQTFGFGVFFARLDSRVSYLETNRVDTAAFAVMSEKITQVQANSADTKQDIGTIKTDITNLKEEIRRSGFNGKR